MNFLKLSFVVLVSVLSLFTFVFTVVHVWEDAPISLADTSNRSPGPHGMPGFYGAEGGTCLAHTASVMSDAYVGSLVKDAATLHDARDRAMVYIMRSAIADTPEGDVVDFGGTSEVLFLRVLREMDLCGRRLWAIPGSETPPLDAYRLRTARCSSSNCSAVPVNTIAMLRISGDRFESAADSLTAFYGRIQIGGFVFVDGYYAHPKLKAAVDRFRFALKIVDQLSHIEEETRDSARPYLRAVWWQKTS